MGYQADKAIIQEVLLAGRHAVITLAKHLKIKGSGAGKSTQGAEAGTPARTPPSTPAGGAAAAAAAGAAAGVAAGASAGAAVGAAADAALAEAAKANGASTSEIRRALRALRRKVTEAREMDLMKQGRCEGLRRVREIAHRRVERALAALTEAAAAECDDE